jgi:hypothetical protein
MVTLARDLDFLRSRFFTGLTAVFFARLHQATTGQVCTLGLLICRHYRFSFLNSQNAVPNISGPAS